MLARPLRTLLAMRGWLVRRLIAVPLMAFAISFLLFALLLGRPELRDALMFGEYSAEALAAIIERFGFGEPLLMRYGEWVWGALRGDFGPTYFLGALYGSSGNSTADELGSRLPVTAELGLLTLLLAALIGVPLGIVSAIRQGTRLDRFLRVATSVGSSLPNFWIGSLALTLPVIWWGWSPQWDYVRFEDDPLANLKIMIWPAMMLAVASAASLAHVMRASTLEMLSSDYVRTARAKGQRERAVVFGHVLPSSLVAVIPALVVQVGAILGTVMIAEMLFRVPGLGYLALESAWLGDHPAALAAVMALVVLFLLTKLALDVVHRFAAARMGTAG